MGTSLAVLVFLVFFAVWARTAAPNSWRIPVYTLLAVVGFPVAFGLLTLALDWWTDWWNGFLGVPLLVVILAAAGFFALVHAVGFLGVMHMLGVLALGPFR
ncbi:hypothetical protein Ga0074812_107295 [Parafrankia irregularis]|uniref:Uncharacterized protein n=1 Tax=Parafrankia irregularis TaxID=795642 RepID=A0A0S4QL81_9ACTN|nr:MULTISPECIES: hypothetical protein [Parafrankia]MBE3201156.1 hypothetical protein [Parafrankia sp. CH37]CUU56411.1 hypothetical protein Ga0074812_107295 [Parafrankia irregularis]